MIEKRKREELYNKFRQGAVPSGADFADLIRSQLNLLDDGIDISENPDDPIGLRAHGMKENLLDFSDQENRRRWTISGRCEDESKEGLNVKADENSKLYIERESGNLGLSTDQPTAKLHIIQTSATNALRIDDEGNDRTPLIVTSDGQVGIGLDSPVAKLHVSYSGIGNILRVDDTEDDTTPFIITDTGNVGIGYSDPKAKLAIDGAVSIGKNPDPQGAGFGGNDLYVGGNLEVGGSVIFSGDSNVGGIEINAPLTSKTKEVVIKDNLKIIPDPGGPGKPASDGNLSVAGDTTLGTFNKVPANQNVVTINGQIRSGGELGDEQYELVVNDILTLNRNTNSPQATIQGSFEVIGSTSLGNDQSDQIRLNGIVRSDTGNVIIDDGLEVKGNTILGDSSADIVTINGKVNSSIGDVVIEDNLQVNGSTTLGTIQGDRIILNGKVSSNVGNVTIDDQLTVTGSVTMGDQQSDEIILNGTLKSNTGAVIVSDSMTINNDLNVNGSLMFDNSSTKVEGIVTAVDGNDDKVLTTEGAVKRYVDNQVSSLNTKITTVDGKIPSFYRDIRYQRIPGYTNDGGWGRGHLSTYNFYPPAGFNMSQLIHVSVSPANIPFSGTVNRDDTLACYAEVYSNYIRCICGNSEQRDYSTVALYALWRR